MRVSKRFMIQVRVCDEFEGRTMERSVQLTTEQILDFAERRGEGSGYRVWTHDAEEFRRCSDELEAGATLINAMVVSDTP